MIFSSEFTQATTEKHWHPDYTVFVVRVSKKFEIKKPPLPKGRGTTEGGGGIYG